ncbi:hypothetical protein NE237_009553 [Protea cynaroides]|uniref:Uncharacterized protein n=1 Tax=Protea cynaroides TaxID=273540 RepID=A0A9Q0KXN5_9MAGN|nr:hypothetical protein NE237_009553 [Protea cynaroides]
MILCFGFSFRMNFSFSFICRRFLILMMNSNVLIKNFGFFIPCLFIWIMIFSVHPSNYLYVILVRPGSDIENSPAFETHLLSPALYCRSFGFHFTYTADGVGAVVDVEPCKTD